MAYIGQTGTSTTIERRYKENICRKCPHVRMGENKISWYCTKTKRFDTKKEKCQHFKIIQPKKKSKKCKYNSTKR